MEDVISLRQYIDNREQISTVKIQTFCRLMKRVSDAIDKEKRNLVRINLDDIKINVKTGEIVLPVNLFSDLDKTIAGINTGISLIADRKSSREHKKVAFALMVLGWYVNPDGSAVMNDIQVLENFDFYMSKVPNWLQDFFVGVFRRMDYEVSFGDYYEKNFNEKIKQEISNAFAPYNLTDEQFARVSALIAKITNRMVKEGVSNG